MVPGKVTFDNDLRIANIFNSHFTNITKTLNITQNERTNGSLSDIFEKNKNHISILKIKNLYQNDDELFQFKKISEDNVRYEIKMLSKKKASISNDIPIRILKECCNTMSKDLTLIFNQCIENNDFPNPLKLAEITPIFKKNDNTNKENYRPISTLSNVAKIFERIIHKQISDFMEQKFSKYLSGFRKNYNTQISLLKMLETWKNNLNRGNKVGALIMDLSKAFDTLNHDLILAKLEAYGFSKDAILFIKSYLDSRQQRTKINTTFSDWLEILCGVPQGSILGPLLFDIFINDLFLLDPRL